MTQSSFSINPKFYLSIGAFFCMLSLIFSSLTSHLPASYFVSNGKEFCRIADNVLVIQGMSLIVLALVQKFWMNSIHFTLIGIVFIFGSISFCTGVFYVALVGDNSFIIFAAPMGGSSLTLAWLYLAIAGLFLK